jgi:hypothetical protein
MSSHFEKGEGLSPFLEWPCTQAQFSTFFFGLSAAAAAVAAVAAAVATAAGASVVILGDASDNVGVAVIGAVATAVAMGIQLRYCMGASWIPAASSVYKAKGYWVYWCLIV